MAKLKAPGPWHALHFLPSEATSILDVGCNTGATLEHAHLLGLKHLYGIEINTDAAELARNRLKQIDDVNIYQGSADNIPLPAQSIDVAVCTEVLEHIPADLRPKVIQEVHRVLKNDSRFILTVPMKGLFGWLDPANVRFMLPRAYDIASRIVGGEGREAGFVDQKHGVVWHHHFTLPELQGLFGKYFDIELVRWRGALLAPICSWLQFPFFRLRAYDSSILKLINKLAQWDYSIQLGETFAYNAIVVFKKKP